MKFHISYYLAGAFQGALATLFLLSSPSDPENQIFLGFSGGRLIMLALSLGITFAFTWLSVQAYRPSDRQHRWFRYGTNSEVAGRFRKGLLVACFTTLLAGTALLLILARGDVYIFAPRGDLPTLEADAYFADLTYFGIESYLRQLLPLLYLAIGLSLLTILYSLLPGVNRPKLASFFRNRTFQVGMLIFGLFLFSWGLAGGRQLNLETDEIGWNTLGGPILDVQLMWVFLAGVGFVLLAVFLKKRSPRLAELSPGRADAVVFIIVWAVAALLWNQAPLTPSWFLAEPRPPNFELYPKSDAVLYDSTGQSMLLGEGLKSYPFNDVFVRRPLYTFLIGIVHTLAGQDYTSASSLQSILLAVFPALVYLIGSRLHSRTGGALAAVLIIFREFNTITLADEITVSHSRLFMSDFPTAVLVALFCWHVLSWKDSSGFKLSRVLASGGLLGAAVLVRMETVIFAAPILLLLLALSNWQIKRAIPLIAAFLLGLVLVLSPWLVRNFIRTGEIFIEVPGNRIEFLFNRLLSDASPASPSGRLSRLVSEQPDSAQASGTLSLVWNHFRHSNVQGILVFPTMFRPLDAATAFLEHRNPERFFESCCSPENYIERLPFWRWYKWDLKLPGQTLLPIVLTLLSLTVGIALSWRKASWRVLFLASVLELYFLINALARTSGGRYILAVDWIWLVFFAVGLGQFCIWLGEWMAGGKYEGLRAVSPHRLHAKAGIRTKNAAMLSAAVVLLLGAVLPVAESLYPKKYPDDTARQWLDEALEVAPDPAAVLQLLDQKGRLFVGGAFYPQIYEIGEEPKPTYQPVSLGDFPGLKFRLLGPVISNVHFPTRLPPVDAGVTNAGDVLVIGCRVEGEIGPFIVAALIYSPATREVLYDPEISAAIRCP